MTEPSIDYDLLTRQLEALISDEADRLANTANMVALIWQAMPRINWAGVYVLRGSDLVLGPFQGNPACVRIPVGKGVCGTAAAERRPIRVADVHDFAGHIACDAASRSELVVPLISEGVLLGVLDIDSPVIERFTQQDEDGIAILSQRFIDQLSLAGPLHTPFI